MQYIVILPGITFKKERRYLTQWELKGLNVLIEWLEGLPQSKKSVPKDIHDPAGLMAEMRVYLLSFHYLSLHSICLIPQDFDTGKEEIISANIC